MSPEPPMAPPPEGYPRITPYLLCEDVDAQLDWLRRAFGFEERHVVRDLDGAARHAEMAFEGGLVMLGRPGGDYRNPGRVGAVTQGQYVYVQDVDAHCARAREAGAEVFAEPEDQEYGDRRYAARDPEGHEWYFAQRLA